MLILFAMKKTQLVYPVPDIGLYSFENEHDACGVGMVASLDNAPTHAIVEMGISILKRLMHRGAAGGDPDTGDGAGILTALPDAFFRANVAFKLPENYGVAMIFDGFGKESEIEQLLKSKNIPILGWRDVPVNPRAIGSLARSTMPRIRQLFVSGEAFATKAEFERKLFVVRRTLEKRYTLSLIHI